jgi:hypothetical protein
MCFIRANFDLMEFIGVLIVQAAKVVTNWDRNFLSKTGFTLQTDHTKQIGRFKVIVIVRVLSNTDWDCCQLLVQPNLSPDPWGSFYLEVCSQITFVIQLIRLGYNLDCLQVDIMTWDQDFTCWACLNSWKYRQLEWRG